MGGWYVRAHRNSLYCYCMITCTIPCMVYVDWYLSLQEKMFHFWINTFFVDMHVMQQETKYAEDDGYLHVHVHQYLAIWGMKVCCNCPYIFSPALAVFQDLALLMQWFNCILDHLQCHWLCTECRYQERGHIRTCTYKCWYMPAGIHACWKPEGH